MSKHTPGEWRVVDCPCGDDVCRSANIEPFVVKIQGAVTRDDAEHIVALHNACLPDGAVAQLLAWARGAAQALETTRFKETTHDLWDAIAAVERIMGGAE